MDKYSFLTSNHIEAIGWFLVQLGATVWGAIKWVGWFLADTYAKMEKLLAGHGNDIQILKQETAIHKILFEKFEGHFADMKSDIKELRSDVKLIIQERRP